MDPKASLSAMLAAAASDSLILSSANSPHGPLSFGAGVQLTADSNTHNQPKTPFSLNQLQLAASLAAANFDTQQFTATSPPNNFIAASPLSSISSSLSSVPTEASPTPFNSLSALSPSDLQQLSKLITPSLNISQTTNTASDSTDVFNQLRNALAQNIVSSSVSNSQAMSSSHSPLYNSNMIVAQNGSPGSQLSTTPTTSSQGYDQFDEAGPSTSSGSRRIRRRRPKSPKSQVAKRTNNGVEIKQEQPMNSIDEQLSDSPTMEAVGMSEMMYTSPIEEFTETLSEEELSRRQKICRVCGDHATGYNFNQVTCESCKAFFRRNALRPKDFKCPYTNNCEINAVSRRFCQKCRLAKCFQVGMKKEWILNDEQLKRRKNSRLNSLKSVGSNASMDPLSPIQPQSNMPVMHSPLPPLPALLSRNQSIEENIVKREPIDQPMQMPTTQHQMVNQQHSPSFMNSIHLNEIRMLNEQCSNGNNAAIQQFLTSSNNQQPQNFLPMMSQYGRLPQMNAGQQMEMMAQQQQVKTPVMEKVMDQSMFEVPVSSQSVSTSSQMHSNLQQMSNVSIEDYNKILQNGGTQPSSASYQSSTQFTMPPTPNSAMMTNMNGHLPSNPMTYSNNSVDGTVISSPVESPQQSSSQLSSPNSNGGNGMFPPFFDWSPRTFRQMEEAIQDEFESSTPGDSNSCHETPNNINFREVAYGEAHTNFTLNSSELCELDIVINAFSSMSEPLSDSRDTEALKKTNHNPSDVMNIIDIIMRRFVKTTKKLPAFNTLSQDAKLCLLKSAMIKMVTMRGVARFDPKKFCWKTSLVVRSGGISCNIFDKLNDKCQKNNFIRLCHSINDAIRCNDIAINLIGLLILFENTDSVKNERDKMLAQKYYAMYDNLLRRYIESIHNEKAGPIYDSVPVTLAELNKISIVAETIFVDRVKDDDETRRLPMEFFKTRNEELSNSPQLAPNQPTTSA
ncbi:hypothetical protein M3Y97_00254200 [Aphelenchoides bicaudatus]|nr:hypothetical protein M3Y97_00254200 [Aphelenchoides bicaudatus]